MGVGTGLMEKGTPTTTTASAGPFLPARTRSLEEEAVEEEEEEEATEAEVPRHGNLLPLLLIASWRSSSSLASPTGPPSLLVTWWGCSIQVGGERAGCGLCNVAVVIELLTADPALSAPQQC